MDITGAAWRKSSYSGGASGNCVEVAAADRTVAVRDSQDPKGPVLAFGPSDWQRFAARVRVRRVTSDPDSGTDLASLSACCSS
jgi:hypothetical protein